jgi:hypothetical protein
MRIMWLNESLVLRGETQDEKRALNVLYQSIGNEIVEPLNGSEFCDSVDVGKAVDLGY